MLKFNTINLNFIDTYYRLIPVIIFGIALYIAFDTSFCGNNSIYFSNLVWIVDSTHISGFFATGNKEDSKNENQKIFHSYKIYTNIDNAG